MKVSYKPHRIGPIRFENEKKSLPLLPGVLDGYFELKKKVRKMYAHPGVWMAIVSCIIAVGSSAAWIHFYYDPSACGTLPISPFVPTWLVDSFFFFLHGL